ncbi:MAG: hypothetical protein ACI9XO_003461 [Paraglaciecola sp.]|jgi:hypothetical protein
MTKDVYFLNRSYPYIIACPYGTVSKVENKGKRNT